MTRAHFHYVVKGLVLSWVLPLLILGLKMGEKFFIWEVVMAFLMCQLG